MKTDDDLDYWLGCKKCSAVCEASIDLVDLWWEEEGQMTHDGCGGPLVVIELEAPSSREGAWEFLQYALAQQSAAVN